MQNRRQGPRAHASDKMPDSSALSVESLHLGNADAKTSMSNFAEGFFSPCICCLPELPSGWNTYPLTVGYVLCYVCFGNACDANP